ncbi:helix-turn-helix transcriptional regulator [Pukyongiella litopenaei]|uniref:HTH domain-containing protein n=1 Tax=Pukyongiella litopenaei TaxID=2605946 RepID=A0A2S0MMI9_9RHOB|nr:HTH domain-containing protein [Pukyongiella litopenaei]AVO37086.1 HTH domain-containing protein [Pukyongiella litopenaei]
MTRDARLLRLIDLLRDGQTHRAADLAVALGVSDRTIWRDMARLERAGVPVGGTRGSGYRLEPAIALPPLQLAPGELEALLLGLAIVSRAADPDLAAAAAALADRVDAALPAETVAEGAAWKTALEPLSDPARALRHMATLRGAIAGRQKLRLGLAGHKERHVVRPLRLESWGALWALTAWCDTHARFATFRLDLIESAAALPETFVDEPGRRYDDHLAALRR